MRDEMSAPSSNTTNRKLGDATNCPAYYIPRHDIQAETLDSPTGEESISHL